MLSYVSINLLSMINRFPKTTIRVATKIDTDHRSLDAKLRELNTVIKIQFEKKIKSEITR